MRCSSCCERLQRWILSLVVASALPGRGLEPDAVGARAPPAILPLVLVPRSPKHLRFRNQSRSGELGNFRKLQGDNIQVQIGQQFAIATTITAGTPRQKLRCLLDSGSADLWLPSKRCTSCVNRKTFDADASATFSPKLVQTALGEVPEKVMVEYGSGPVVGFAVQDSLGFGHFEVSDLSFMLVEKADIPQHPDWDGICGLGWRGMAQAGEPLYERMQKMGHRVAFTFVPASTKQATLVVGEVPTSDAKDGHIAWAPLEQFDGDEEQRFWLVKGRVTPGNPAPIDALFVVDTGTNGVLMVPHSDYAALVKALLPPEALHDACFYDHGTVICECSVLEMGGSPLELEFAGRVFTMTFDKLFFRVEETGGTDACVLLVYSSPVEEMLDRPGAASSSQAQWRLLSRGTTCQKGKDAELSTPTAEESADACGMRCVLTSGCIGFSYQTSDNRHGGRGQAGTCEVWGSSCIKEESSSSDFYTMEAEMDMRAKRRSRRLSNMKDSWVLGGGFFQFFIVSFDFDHSRVGFAEPEQPVQILPVLSRAEVLDQADDEDATAMSVDSLRNRALGAASVVAASIISASIAILLLTSCGPAAMSDANSCGRWQDSDPDSELAEGRPASDRDTRF